MGLLFLSFYPSKRKTEMTGLSPPFHFFDPKIQTNTLFVEPKGRFLSAICLAIEKFLYLSPTSAIL